MSESKTAQTTARFFGNGLKELEADEVLPDLSNVMSVVRTQVMSRDEYRRYRDKMNDQSESGWVIERGDSSTSRPAYAADFSAIFCGGIGWSHDHMKAIRFARKADAESVMLTLNQPEAKHRVCEHGWE